MNIREISKYIVKDMIISYHEDINSNMVGCC
jgi:hypothetical protein